MPRSTMPELSMEIEHPEEEETGYLKQSEYLKKPQKPSSLKKPVENTVEPEEAVEKPVKKKRVMSEKQKAALAKAREVSAKKRKEKKAMEGTTQKPVLNTTKAKKHLLMPAIDEESDSSSDDDDDEAPLIQHETPHVIQQRSTPKKKQSVEERVYQRIMSEKLERKTARAQKKQQDKLAREYEESIREDERRLLYEMTQKAPPKPKKQVDAKSMLQPSMWEQAFLPKRSPFGF